MNREYKTGLSQDEMTEVGMAILNCLRDVRQGTGDPLSELEEVAGIFGVGEHEFTYDGSTFTILWSRQDKQLICEDVLGTDDTETVVPDSVVEDECDQLARSMGCTY